MRFKGLKAAAEQPDARRGKHSGQTRLRGRTTELNSTLKHDWFTWKRKADSENRSITPWNPGALSFTCTSSITLNLCCSKVSLFISSLCHLLSPPPLLSWSPNMLMISCCRNTLFTLFSLDEPLSTKIAHASRKVSIIGFHSFYHFNSCRAVSEDGELELSWKQKFL